MAPMTRRLRVISNLTAVQNRIKVSINSLDR